MLALLSSFAVVALAEMGDKTQLIALTLGLRYRRPWIVMLGILAATLFNHGLASALGMWGAARFDAAFVVAFAGTTEARLEQVMRRERRKPRRQRTRPADEDGVRFLCACCQ